MSQHRSLSDTRNTWPSSEKLWRVVTLRDYNTRMVFLGTLLLGVCAGLVGTFTLIRKRALVGDVVGHAALPGEGGPAAHGRAPRQRASCAVATDHRRRRSAAPASRRPTPPAGHSACPGPPACRAPPRRRGWRDRDRPAARSRRP
ncbi:MAG: metal ABC transporter permease [Planctomycetes bacterium]|nr:metal ABC transporter permease [Planctomycetota bacterium]